MARQECNNIFSDGLIMDLNPINTPKSVLTDCLNGTYITYNGNEFVLQNDMGNYKLKNCKLPTNFIPVGVKGYGDILYIVSYNPITNETEIGSYPAPQSIFTTGDSEALLAPEGDLTPFIINGEAEYPEIIRTDKKPIFIFSGGTEEDTYKLNPGDEFKFTGSIDVPTFKYQHLNFYVIDEDNKLYDIDDTQIYGESGNLVSQNMRKVFWETPGWLAAQYDLYVPDKFNLNLRSLNVPEFLLISDDEEVDTQANSSLADREPGANQFKVSMNLSSQTIITDLLFQNELNKDYGSGPFKDLYIRYLIRTANDESDYGSFQGIIDETTNEEYENGTPSGNYTYFDIPVYKHNYQDDIITAYNNIQPIWFFDNPDKTAEGFDVANYKGVVELTAYPIIKHGGSTLKYTQFSTTQRFPLNTLKNSSDITIADSIYKWSVDDDSCTISFNINGPFINASDITGKYEIYRINLFDYTDQLPSKNTKPDLDNPNPESKSNFKIGEDNTILTVDSDGNPASFEFIESNKNPKTKIDTLDTSLFTEQRKLLMCEGDLSNLVLYGQNTINVDWSSSNEYKLINYKNVYTNPNYNPDEEINEDTNPGYLEDTSFVGYNKEYPDNSEKTINFSKEGGIYIFRVILEQSEKQLYTSEKVLIPSQVFNDYFGSVDNYLNDITSAMWTGQWMEYVSQPLMINDLQVDFNTEEEITEATTWDEFVLRYGLKEAPIELVYKLNANGILTDEVDWEKTIVNGMKETSGNTYQWLSTPATFRYLVDIAKLNPQITLRDGITSINKLEGNLWNPILIGNTVLKTNVNDEIINLDIDGSISFAKTIEIPWNLTNPNSTDTFAKLGDDVYLFDPPRDTSMSGEYSYPNIRLYGEQNGNGDRTNRCWVRVRYDISWANGSGNILSKQQNTYKDKEYTSCDSTAFSLIGDGLSIVSAAWGKYSYDLGNRISDNSRAYLYRDSDDNSDKGQIGRQDTPYTGIQLFATGGNSNLKNKTVAIHLNPTDVNKFVWGLMHIVAVNNSNTPSTVYYPTFGVDSIIENEIVTLTKYTTNLSLAYLRIDDLIINKNLSDLSEYSETLLSTPVINLNKIINNSMSNLIVNLDYSDNIKYNTFIQGITQGINDFNSSQQSNITTASSATQGSYLMAADDPAPNSSVISSEFGDDFKDPTEAKAAADAIIAKLAKRDIRYNYSAYNIGYINESKNTLKYINATRGSGGENLVDGSGSIMICYVEDFNF